MRAVYKANELAHCTDRYTSFECVYIQSPLDGNLIPEGCGSKVNLEPSDPRVGTGKAMVCDKCGGFLIPYGKPMESN